MEFYTHSHPDDSWFSWEFNPKGKGKGKFGGYPTESSRGNGVMTSGRAGKGKGPGTAPFAGKGYPPSWSREQPGQPTAAHGSSYSYRALQQEIVDASRHQDTFIVFLQGLVQDGRPMNMTNICTLIHRSGKLRLQLPKSVAQYILAKLNELGENSPHTRMKAQEVGNVLYGLQSMAECLETREIIFNLLPRIRQCPECLQGQHVGNALYGLQNLTDTPEVRQLLACLVPKMQESREELRSQAIGNGLYGLQRMSDSPEVRQVFAVLIPKVWRCSEAFKSQEIGNALYGLQGTTDGPELRQLLAALTPKVLECSSEFKPQEISNSLYGLQRLRDSYELRQVLAALTPKVHFCTEEFNSQAIGNALYGLRSMTDCREVRQLLAALTLKIEHCRAVMRPQEIGNALYGLQSIGGSSDEIRDVLRALTPKVKQCRETFLAKHITNAFQGLQLVEDSEELQQMLNALRPKLECFSGDLSRRFVNTTLDWLERRSGSAALCAEMKTKVQPIQETVPAPAISLPNDTDFAHVFEVQRYAYDRAPMHPEKSERVQTATFGPLPFAEFDGDYGSEERGLRRPFRPPRYERL
jgi:hypothetical protein